MDSSNKHRAELLGEPFGTATAKLRKAIMFQLVQETNKDVCFRCGEKIKTIEDLSIEHKKSWARAENPKETFFDLNNITFSHLKCNVDARDNSGPRLNARGEKNSQAKLTWKQVDEIREKLKKGISLDKLAKEYNVCKRHITRIRDNIKWKIN